MIYAGGLVFTRFTVWFTARLVLYDAGVEPHVGERLGKLALTDTGIFRREMQVLSTCVSSGYPFACVIGGGYADDINCLVYRHSLLHRAVNEIYNLSNRLR